MIIPRNEQIFGKLDVFSLQLLILSMDVIFFHPDFIKFMLFDPFVCVKTPDELLWWLASSTKFCIDSLRLLASQFLIDRQLARNFRLAGCLLHHCTPGGFRS